MSKRAEVQALCAFVDLYPWSLPSLRKLNLTRAALTSAHLVTLPKLVPVFLELVERQDR